MGEKGKRIVTILEYNRLLRRVGNEREFLVIVLISSQVTVCLFITFKTVDNSSVNTERWKHYVNE